jgi:hypothetical protein
MTEHFDNRDHQIKQLFLSARNTFYKAHVGRVYILGSSLGYYKVGLTTNLTQRFSNFGVKLPFDVWLENSKTYFDCGWAEKYWHLMFDRERVNGEWFQLDEFNLRSFDRASDDRDLDVKLNHLIFNDGFLEWDIPIMTEVLKGYATYIPERKRLLAQFEEFEISTGGVMHHYTMRKMAEQKRRREENQGQTK